jgi:hypothetical protein
LISEAGAPGGPALLEIEGLTVAYPDGAEAVLERPDHPNTQALIAASRLPARGNPDVTSMA